MSGVFHLSLSTNFLEECRFGSLMNEKVVSNFVPGTDLWSLGKGFQKSGLEKGNRILLKWWRNLEGREEENVKKNA